MASDHISPGDELVAAIWLDGSESKDLIEAYRNELSGALRNEFAGAGLETDSIRHEMIQPGGAYLPPVPDHIDGPEVVCMVVTARAGGPKKPVLSTEGFVANLEARDLLRLRAITRRAYSRYGTSKRLTDAQCDAVIEALGPEAALATIKDAVDSGTIH